MADYSSIKGNRVQYLSSDPTLDSNSEGQVWYNSTTNSLKGLVQIKAFSSGANYPISVYGQIGGAGTQTAGLAYGGRRDGVPTNDYDKSNEYNGYSWSAAPDLGTGRYGVNGCGTQTAAIGAGGYRWPTPPTGLQTTVEEYDGSSWTAGGTLPTGVSSAAMNGVQTAALLSGGNATRTEVLSYNGSTWTSEPSLNAGRRSLRGSGTTTDAIVFGGVNPGAPIIYSNTESFDGSSWTEVGNMNTAIYDMDAMGSTSSHVTSNSGYNGTANTNITEEWDGQTWITAPSSSSNHRGGVGFGTATAGVSGMGSNSYTGVEEYFSDIANYSASSTAAWASGGNLNNNSQGRAGFGTQTAAVAGPGVGPGGGIATTENYDGSTWTNGASSTRSPTNLNRYVAGAGTPTAGAIASGGYPGTMTAATEEYDGSAWTAGNNVNTARRGYVFDGAVITSSLITGGNTQPYPGTTTLTAATEHYDGTSWTSGGSMNTGRTNHGGSSTGSQTSSLMFGGNYPPGPPFGQTSNTEEYNGTSWTEVNNTPVTRSYWGYAGSQTSTIAFQGYTTGSPAQTSSITYDGTNWSSSANSTLGRLNYHNNSGTSTAAIVFGGEGPVGNVTTTEEFTGASPATPTGAAASTITTS